MAIVTYLGTINYLSWKLGLHCACPGQVYLGRKKSQSKQNLDKMRCQYYFSAWTAHHDEKGCTFMSAIVARRQALIEDLKAKRTSLSELQTELKSSTGADKNRLLSMMKSEMKSVKEAQESLDDFNNAPLVLPELKVAALTIEFHPDNTHFDATLWVTNDSPLPALGSFELDLSVAYYTYDQDPPLRVDDVFPTITPDSTDVQPGGTNPFVYPNCVFVTKRGSRNALYTFDVLLYAGPDGVAGNDTKHWVKWLQPPLITQPTRPTTNAPPNLNQKG